MGAAYHRPGFRAGINEKHEDEWWLNERMRNDRATAADMAPFDASMCWDESCHAGITVVSYSTVEQNKEISESRKKLEMKDTQTLLNALAEQNPFTA